jgi:hypothetical protein
MPSSNRFIVSVGCLFAPKTRPASSRLTCYEQNKLAMYLATKSVLEGIILWDDFPA